MTLFILYALMLLVFFGLIHLRSSGNPIQRVWPDKSRPDSYYQVFFATLFLSALLCGAIVIFQGWRLAVLASCIPLLGTTLISLYLKKALIFRQRAGVSQRSQRKDLFAYRVGYLLTTFFLIILLGVLPAVAFFKIAHDVEMERFIKHGQLHLAKSLEERAERIWSRYASKIKADRQELKDELVKKRLMETRDVYNSFFFHTCWEPVDYCQLKIPEDPQAYFKQFLVKISPLYNRACVEMCGLMEQASADKLWQWELSSSPGLILHKEAYKEGNRQDRILHISSQTPSLKAPGQTAGRIGLALAVVAFFLTALFCLARFIAHKVFLLNLDEPAKLYGEDLDAHTMAQNLLVVGSPFAKQSERWKKEHFDPIDFIKVARKNSVETIKYEDLLGKPDGVIAIDHFDYQMEDAQLNRDRIRLLEELLVSNKTVVLVSTVDLTSYRLKTEAEENGVEKVKAETSAEKKQSSLTPNNGDHWTEVLSSFTKHYLEDTRDPRAFLKGISQMQEKTALPAATSAKHRLSALFKVVQDECKGRAHLQEIGEELISRREFKEAALSPQELGYQILDQARAYYNAIWATCSKDEKLTLLYLAHDRFLSWSNLQIRQLLKRGLIVRDPCLRLMNDSFRRFVIDKAGARPEGVDAWKEEGARSHWSQLKGPLLLGLISVAVLLFTTQPEVFNSSIVFVSAVTAGIPGIFKLFDLMQGKPS
jgi:hypothetical protein